MTETQIKKSQENDEIEQMNEAPPLEPGEYVSHAWLHIEDLLKSHLVRRKNATKTLEDTQEYVMLDNSIDCKKDLLESLLVGSQKLTADRIQSTADPEARVIGVIESVDKQLAYSNDSIRRRREQARREIKELDDLIECVEQLPSTQRDIINNLYYSFEIELIDGTEIKRPVKYAVAAKASGYQKGGNFEQLRKKSISRLVVMMRKKREQDKK